jgi:hypothetical protein
MREHPDGAELLAIAREVLRKELMPLLPKEKAYAALMVMNAMGIAERQLAMGAEPQSQEQAALILLLNQEGGLAELNKVFAKKIRTGDFDASAPAQNLLWSTTLQRVRESAPKALRPTGAVAK